VAQQRECNNNKYEFPEVLENPEEPCNSRESAWVKGRFAAKVFN
jgi:hypothetical protein